VQPASLSTVSTTRTFEHLSRDNRWPRMIERLAKKKRDRETEREMADNLPNSRSEPSRATPPPPLKLHPPAGNRMSRIPFPVFRGSTQKLLRFLGPRLRQLQLLFAAFQLPRPPPAPQQYPKSPRDPIEFLPPLRSLWRLAVSHHKVRI